MGRKEAAIPTIMEAVRPYVAANERLLAMASGESWVTEPPLKSSTVRSRLRRLVRLVPVGRSVHVVLTSEQLIMTDPKGRRGNPVLAMPISSIRDVDFDRHQPFGFAGYGYGPPSERVRIEIETADQLVRLRFVHDWLEEGEAIARGLMSLSVGWKRERWRSDAATKSNDEMRKGWAKLRELGEISQAEYEAKIAGLD